MLKSRLITRLALTATILLGITGFANAALNWDGQSGVFLNALAYTAAPSSVETAAHYADLGTLGSVSTYNVAFGLKHNVELGYTKYDSNVTGVSDQSNLTGKWQFLGETPQRPAAAAWMVQRHLAGGTDTTDLGLSATKILKVADRTVILDLGARSTKALGLGLFGVGSDRQIKYEGLAAVFITDKFIVGTEFKQQINARTFKDIAFRYIVNDKLNLDAGIANFAPGISNQWAFAATYKL